MRFGVCIDGRPCVLAPPPNVNPVLLRLCSAVLVARLSMLVAATLTAALAWWSPASLTHAVIRTGGAVSMGILAVFTGLVLLAWADLVLCDLFERRWAVSAHRHRIYAVLAGAYLVQALAAAHYAAGAATILIAGYVATALVMLWHVIAQAIVDTVFDTGHGDAVQ